MLDVLGLTEDEAAGYRHLVAVASATIQDVATSLRLDADRAATLMARLQAQGLVTRSSAESGHFVASPPSVALGAMIVQRQEDLRLAQVELGELGELYRGAAVGRQLMDIVDVVMGTDAVRQRFMQLQMGARREVLAFVKPEVVAVSAADNVAEDQAVERGVSYRVVVERSLVERPGFYDSAVSAREQGEEIRVASVLPSRLLIIDRELALLPLLGVDADQSSGALLVHASGLLEMLISFFEAVWQSSAPLASRDIEPGKLGETDTQILTLLNAGLTDRAVAHQLRLSMRTVQRRVRALMDVVEVETRLQLGFAAARRGWLESSPRA